MGGVCLWTLAKKGLLLRNFRQLALASGIGKLGPESLWDNAECLTAVVRQYVPAVTGEAEGWANGVDLLQGAERGDAQLVLELLEKPHDPNAADANSRKTPLHSACANGHLVVVQCLLDAGADKEKAARDGATPLLLAAFQGHHAVVQCLLDAGAERERKLTTVATHPCIWLRGRAMRELCSACWMPVLTKRRRTAMASHHCI